MFFSAIQYLETKKNCIELPSLALNIMLSTFAAECQHLPQGARSYWSLPVARRALSSKPAVYHCCCRSMGQITYRQAPYHYINPSLHTMQAALITDTCYKNRKLSIHTGINWEYPFHHYSSYGWRKHKVKPLSRLLYSIQCFDNDG